MVILKCGGLDFNSIPILVVFDDVDCQVCKVDIISL